VTTGLTTRMSPATPAEAVNRRTVLASFAGVLGVLGVLTACGQSNQATSSTGGNSAATSSSAATSAAASPLSATSASAASTATSAVTSTPATSTTASAVVSAAASATGSGKATQLQGMTHLSVQKQKEAIGQLTAAFSKANPQFQINWTFIPEGSWVALMTKLTAVIAGNDPPDITYMNTGNLDNLRRRGAVVALDSLIAKSADLHPEDFDQAAFGTCKFAGKTWALPFSGNMGTVGYYNTDLFSNAGLAAAPKSWDELITETQKLTKLDATGAMAQEGFEGHDGAAWAWYPFLWGAGGDLYDQSGSVPKPIWDSPASIESLQYLVDLVYKYRVWSLGKAPQGGWDAGKVGIWINSGVFSISDLVAHTDLHWKAFLPPSKLGPTPAPVRSGADDLNLYVTPRQDAAWLYLEYMTNTANLATWATAWGGPPPRRSSRQTKTFQDFVNVTPGMPDLIAGLNSPTTVPAVDFYGQAEAYAALLAQYKATLQNKATPHDALAQSAQQATAILQKMYQS